MANEVVKALLVEIDGNVEKLRKALREGGVDLDKFAKQASSSNEKAAVSAEQLGSRSATAARGAASALETIARTGNASGEAMKQLVAQGSNVVGMFGATGAVVGAVGISLLAIIQMVQRAK